MDTTPPSPGTLRICPACHNPVEAGHKFCETCGAKMPELPCCSKCGAQFLAPVKFCEMCGTPVLSAGEFPGHEAGPDTGLPEPEYLTEAGPEQESFAEPAFVAEVPEPLPVEPVTAPHDIPAEEPDLPEVVPEKIPPAGKPHPQKAPAAAAGPDPLAPAFSGLSSLPDQPGPKKPETQKSPSRLPLAAGAVVILIILAAGVYFVGLPMLRGGGPAPGLITAPPPVSTPVPAMPEPPAEKTIAAPQPPQTPEPTPTPDPLVPVETQLMPKSQEVYFDVQKDGVTNEITVLYQRGPGENVLRKADIRVTYPDGTVRTGSITPSVGETEFHVIGSRETDRVEVIALMHSGQAFRIKDVLVT
ncbi:MAG: zinc ribbon domain-containing protein [Methanomicrobiales archaeon]|nr:zinc ribbon domain-containing protein [Methanomicrobiales archaeon]